VEAKSVLHAHAMNTFFHEVARAQMAAFEERCRALYPDPVVRPEEERLHEVFATHCLRRAGDEPALDLGALMRACQDLGGFSGFDQLATNAGLAAAVFANLDHSCDGWVNQSEFVQGVWALAKATPRERAEHMFHVINASGDGRLSCSELEAALDKSRLFLLCEPHIHTLARR
jgi:hypothetical protein